MNAYERVMSAIEFKPVDRTSVCPFVMAFAAKFAKVPYGQYCTDYREMAKAQLACVEHFNYDIVTADTDAYREAQACGASIEFPHDDLPIENQKAITDKKDLLKFNLDQIMEFPRLVDKIEGVRELKRFTGGEVPVLGWVEAPYQSASLLRGLTEMMMDQFDDPSFVEELLEFTTELAIKYSIAQIEAGADIIGVGDAVASLISIGDFDKYVLPYTIRLKEAIQQKGAKMKYHICGDSNRHLDSIRIMSPDLVNLDYKVDLAKARAVLDHVCIKGNVNPAEVLMKGSTDKIIAESEKCIQIGGKGFILSPGCEVPKNTPPENFKTFVEVAQNNE